MNEKINLRQWGHLYFELEDNEWAYYTSLNFDYVNDGDGIHPSGIIHCYLLHPTKGSIVTQLLIDPDTNLYLVDDDQPMIDSEILDEINEKLKEHIKNIK